MPAGGAMRGQHSLVGPKPHRTGMHTEEFCCVTEGEPFICHVVVHSLPGEKIGQYSDRNCQKKSLKDHSPSLPTDLSQFSLVFDLFLFATKFSRAARGKGYSGFIACLKVTDSGS